MDTVGGGKDKEQEWADPVEVDHRVDLEAGIEETIRRDTGEVVSTRVLTPDERQGVLRFVRDAEDEEHDDAAANE